MDIEIISVEIKKGIVMITGIDVSDENLRRMERMKDDGMQTEVTFCFDSHQSKDLQYLYNWLKRQKAAKGATTWGEALHKTIGTITVIAKKYRSWLFPAPLFIYERRIDYETRQIHGRSKRNNKSKYTEKGFAASDPGTGYQAGQVDLGSPFP